MSGAVRVKSPRFNSDSDVRSRGSDGGSASPQDLEVSVQRRPTFRPSAMICSVRWSSRRPTTNKIADLSRHIEQFEGRSRLLPHSRLRKAAV